MEHIKIGKKFTCAGMGFDSDALNEIIEETPKGETPILNILALVASVKAEANRLDPSKTSNRFIGQFEVTNLINGETGMFAEAFFPGVADSYVLGFKDGKEGSVALAFTLTVEKDNAKNSAQGYKFGMTALVNKQAEADPFKAYRGLMPGVKKALPASAASTDKPKGGKGK